MAHKLHPSIRHSSKFADVSLGFSSLKPSLGALLFSLLKCAKWKYCTVINCSVRFGSLVVVRQIWSVVSPEPASIIADPWWQQRNCVHDCDAHNPVCYDVLHHNRAGSLLLYSGGPGQVVILYFNYIVCLINFSVEGETAGPGNHFITGHFPNDKGWRWNDESWNDMISLTERGATRQKTCSFCSAVVSVLSEPWNNDRSLFISVYSVNHNTSEMSLAFRRRTIDLVCALLHQRAVTGLHPNWGN